MAETKKPAAKSAAVKKTATKAAPAKKPAAPKAAAPAEAKPVAKKVSKGNKKPNATTRLQDKYNNEIKPSLIEKFHYESVMQAPKLEKIVINIGVGDALQDNKALENAVRELGQITGQHPVTTKAKKSIATFKLREGQAIGCKVTLRGMRMYEFLDRLVSIALPRVRDFRGVSKNSFDGHGNYTLGIKEQLIFPEIDYDKVSKIRGMDIVIVTTAKKDDEAYALLEALGMPFHK
ncbi:MAG: 50S ribosomal protein L5 [Firmicutes bacterium]|nr:50S ribosomal protein L5 [Candidatus Fiminaster equi]